MLKEIWDIRINTPLHLKMAPLAKRHEIPPRVIRLVAVEMVDCQDMAAFVVVWMMAANTLMSRCFADGIMPRLSAWIVLAANRQAKGL